MLYKLKAFKFTWDGYWGKLKKKPVMEAEFVI